MTDPRFMVPPSPLAGALRQPKPPPMPRIKAVNTKQQQNEQWGRYEKMWRALSTNNWNT